MRLTQKAWSDKGWPITEKLSNYKKKLRSHLSSSGVCSVKFQRAQQENNMTQQCAHQNKRKIYTYAQTYFPFPSWPYDTRESSPSASTCWITPVWALMDHSCHLLMVGVSFTRLRPIKGEQKDKDLIKNNLWGKHVSVLNIQDYSPIFSILVNHEIWQRPEFGLHWKDHLLLVF